MKVIWTDFTTDSLYEIFKYYKEAASKNVAHRIISRIFSATRQLSKYPLMGQSESNLLLLRSKKELESPAGNMSMYSICNTTVEYAGHNML